MPMRARSQLRTVAHTVEDAEGLLNSLLLLTVLMLAFAVNQTTAIFSLEDFLEADKREATAYWNYKGRPEIIKDGAWGHGPISHFFIIRGMWSILLLVLALVLGVISYISLCYSDARESPEFLKLWWKVHRWIMAVAWLAFLAGTFFFLQGMHAALDIAAPRYDSFTMVNGTLSEPASQDLDFGITLLLGKQMNNGIIWVIVVTAVLGLLLHVVLVFFLHPDKKAPETTEVDVTLEKAPQETTEVDQLLAALRQVLLSSSAV
jgi:hypothetical protein